MLRPLLLSLIAFTAQAQVSPFQASEGGAVALNYFQLPDDLEITVWAHSPMLANPTNIDIDAQGRIWVTEGVNYRGYNKGGKRRAEGDRVVVLSDTKGTGKADTAQTFFQDANWTAPLGIAVLDNVIIVSHAPDLIKFTDVNRDGKFDPAIDKKEILLTGFGGQDHDHSLHAVIAGPDGKLYLNAGNCGGNFTDKSGKTFRIASFYDDQRGGVWPYDRTKTAAVKSDDGFTWVSGFSARMNEDGSQVEVIGNGYRNSFEHFPSSFGDLFQADNDDSLSCRTSFVLEYAAAGYTTPSGAHYKSVRRGLTQPVPRAHWRQDDPDTFDAGDIYGSGSPAGFSIYENGALDAKWNGSLLVCESSRNAIFSYKIQPQKSSFKLDAETRKDFLTSNAAREYFGTDFKKVKETDKVAEKVMFRPSDICVGPDGAIYIADWYDARVGGHQTFDDTCTGAIYRIAPKGFKSVIPKLDLTTPVGAAAALRSPSANIRILGFKALKAFGIKALPVVMEVMRDANPYIAARGIWLLPYLGDEGRTRCESLLRDPNPQNRLVAFRALRRAGQEILPYAQQLVNDSDPAIRRELATTLHGYSAADALPLLVKLAPQVDVADKNSVTAFGIGSTGKTNEVWAAIKTSPESWTPQLTKLAWVLHAPTAVADFAQRARDAKLTVEQRAFAVESLSFVETREAALAMIELCAKDSPVKAEATTWVLMRMTGAWSGFNIKPELKAAGIYDEETAVVMPIESVEPPKPTFTEQDVFAKKGDAEKGAVLVQRCTMCHQVNGVGASFGPELRGYAARQSAAAVVRAIVNPSADIALGYEGKSITLKAGGRVDGIVVSENDPMVVTSTGGVTQLIPRSRIALMDKPPVPGAPATSANPPEKVQQIEKMTRSLMMSADQLGLTAQDVADIAAWLATYK